jgi:hypothetical protein
VPGIESNQILWICSQKPLTTRPQRRSLLYSYFLFYGKYFLLEMGRWLIEKEGEIEDVKLTPSVMGWVMVCGD